MRECSVLHVIPYVIMLLVKLKIDMCVSVQLADVPDQHIVISILYTPMSVYSYNHIIYPMYVYPVSCPYNINIHVS